MADSLEKTPTPDLSQRMVDNQKASDRFGAMARQHAAKVGAVVGQMLGAEHEATSVALVKALAECMTTRCDRMVGAEVELTRELADDAAPRNERDLQEKLTREAIVDVRERVVGMYGQAMLSTVLMAGSAPKDPKELVIWALRTAKTLDDMKPADFPESKIEGGKPSPKKWAALIRKPADKLDAALKIVDREAAELVTALAQRNDARGVFETDIVRANDLLEGFLRFAGMSAEADRLERTVSSASSSGANTDEEPVSEPKPPAPVQGQPTK